MIRTCLMNSSERLEGEKQVAPPVPLDTGTVGEVHKHKTLLHNDFRRAGPLSKSWTVDQWMSAISLIDNWTCDNLSTVQSPSLEHWI